MKGWLKSRLESQGLSVEAFGNATGIKERTLNRWDEGDITLATVNQKIEKIAKFFGENNEDLIKDYQQSKIDNLQSKIDNLPDYLRFLANSIDSFDKCEIFREILSNKLNAANTYEIVKKTDELIKNNTKAEATQKFITTYSDAIDLLLSQHEDLGHVEQLVTRLALVCANEHPEFNTKSYISIRLESEFDGEMADIQAAWSIQMMIDKERASALVTTLVTKDSYLDTKGAVLIPSDLTRLPAETKSDTEIGIQKELHSWVTLIASKLGDPEIRIPDLSDDDYSEEKNGKFWSYSPEIQAKIGAKNNSVDFIFATVKDTVPAKLSDLVLEYFTPKKDGEDANPALKLYQLSKTNGCSSYHLDLGIFTEWIKDRLDKIENEKIARANSQSKQKGYTRNAKSEGQRNGNIYVGNVENLDMKVKQDNRRVQINHYNNLEALQDQLNNSRTDHGLNHIISELKELDPKTTDKKEQEKITELWSRIKTGVDKFNATSKTVTAFHKAYDTACNVAQYLDKLS